MSVSQTKFSRDETSGSVTLTRDKEKEKDQSDTKTRKKSAPKNTKPKTSGSANSLSTDTEVEKFNMSTATQSQAANKPQCDRVTVGENSTCCAEAEYWRTKYMEMESRIQSIEQEMQSFKQVGQDTTENTSSSKDTKKHLSHFYKLETEQKAEIAQIQFKLNTLTNVVVRMEEQLKEANGKILHMQARSMRRNLIIAGLPEPKNETNQQLLVTIQQFLRETLGFQSEVKLKGFHRLGYTDGSGYRPTIIKLMDLDQKVPLLAAAPNLKGKKNDKDRFFYFNEQLPDQLHEDRKYAQFWIKDNKARPPRDQLQMKIYKNKLRINNDPYKKKVHPPSASEIFKLNLQELSDTRQSPTVYGDSDIVGDSEFISYAVPVTQVEQVRKAYRKLRIKYADATHIISAFRLQNPNGPFNQESSDDGEFGGGRCLMSLLQENDLVDVAIFIIRYYGGKQLGTTRFDTMRALAKTALRKANFLTSTSHTRRQTRSMSQRGAIRGGRQTPLLRSAPQTSNFSSRAWSSQASYDHNDQESIDSARNTEPETEPDTASDEDGIISSQLESENEEYRSLGSADETIIQIPSHGLEVSHNQDLTVR